MGSVQSEDEYGWFEKEKIRMRWLYGGIEDDGGVEGCRLGNKWSREMEKEEGEEKKRKKNR